MLNYHCYSSDGYRCCSPLDDPPWDLPAIVAPTEGAGHYPPWPVGKADCTLVSGAPCGGTALGQMTHTRYNYGVNGRNEASHSNVGERSARRESVMAIELASAPKRVATTSGVRSMPCKQEEFVLQGSKLSRAQSQEGNVNTPMQLAPGSSTPSQNKTICETENEEVQHIHL